MKTVAVAVVRSMELGIIFFFFLCLFSKISVSQLITLNIKLNLINIQMIKNKKLSHNKNILSLNTTAFA